MSWRLARGVGGGVSGRGKQRGVNWRKNFSRLPWRHAGHVAQEKRRLRLRGASESANKASQVASFFQRSSQPPALAPRLRVSQGHQLVVGVIVRSLCPKVSASRGLVAQQSVISPDPCLGLPMQKIHQSAHLSPFCTRTSVPPPCSHGL